MNAPQFVWLKQNPFVRILIPFTGGILLQEACVWPLIAPAILFAIAGISLILFFFLPLYLRLKLISLRGAMNSLLCFSLGALLFWKQDVKNNSNWAGYHYQEKDTVVLTLLETPVEKPKSYKCEAAVDYIIRNNLLIPIKGKLIVYLKKDSIHNIAYGTRLITCAPLREITNTSNPGGFNYQRYCYSQGITHQAFLTSGNTAILNKKKLQFLKAFTGELAHGITRIIQKNITGEKESGLAAAMLIGYKNDLDTTLVQSYTNTGVVHIIAISGMHLGLIYWLLNLLLRPLQQRKQIRWLKPILITALLWIFSLAAGAQPSVLRSALMFTFIVLGDSLSRKTSIYNTLSASAFLLLCINPCWLWDAGFQLSYLAVLSIVIFMRPVYNLLYFKNKIPDAIWKMNAVTIAAQLLTVPVSIYHFHQFPNYFLLTNLIAVPLSGIILIGEILLCTLSFIPALSLFTGRLLSLLIQLMNGWIEKVAALPFATWENLEITVAQTLLLYLLIILFGWWWQKRYKPALFAGLLSLLCFTGIRTHSFVQANNRHQLIVYNIPAMFAGDIIHGRQYSFIGDTALCGTSRPENIHLRRTRCQYRITGPAASQYTDNQIQFLQAGNKKIIVARTTLAWKDDIRLPPIDLLILGGNHKQNLNRLSQHLTIRMIVFDSSVPAWKSHAWKKECDALRIPWYDVSMQGAFVMNLR